ncbi:MAG: peptidoglycan -binding protein [Pseudomonadota bacterium]
MALSRRTGARFQASIWPGFVDAMTGLLLVLMFVLTIFMVVQFVLRETITGQEDKLDALSVEVAALAEALGLEQNRNAALTDRVGTLTATLNDARELEQRQSALIASLQAQTAQQLQELDAARASIASFEDQVAALLAQRETNLGQIAELENEREGLLSEQEQLQLALAGLRDEIDAQTEAARMAAAQSEALEALVADLRKENAEAADASAALTAQLTDLEVKLSEEEKARLAEAAAAEALRARLENADAELTAMTLALEEQRKKAEETLTLLAASKDQSEDLELRLASALLQEQEVEKLRSDLEAANDRVWTLTQESWGAEQNAADLEEVRAELAAALAAKLAAERAAQAAKTQLTGAEQREILLSEARERLNEQTALTDTAKKEQEVLNQQVAALRTQLGELQALLDDAKTRDAAAKIQLQSLGNELNTALARVAAEERRSRELEEAERKRLEEEAARLAAEKENLETENTDLESDKANLERFRSEFFGRLRDVIGGQEGVRIVGDRFVFSSEVLFSTGEVSLAAAGQGELAKVADILRKVEADIPEDIDWVIQVDGHTDDVPIRGAGPFSDNWALSQARALSVVRYMIDAQGISPERLSANGFGQYQPINREDSEEARAQNRRIELKLTER